MTLAISTIRQTTKEENKKNNRYYQEQRKFRYVNRYNITAHNTAKAAIHITVYALTTNILFSQKYKIANWQIRAWWAKYQYVL